MSSASMVKYSIVSWKRYKYTLKMMKYVYADASIFMFDLNICIFKRLRCFAERSGR